MPALRRNRRYARRKPMRSGNKSRVQYRRRYRRARTTRRKRTLTLNAPRSLMPKRVNIKVRMVKTYSLSTINDGHILPALTTAAINDMDYLEDNGYRNFQLEKLTALYNRYRVNGSKIVYTVQPNLHVELHKTNFYSFLGYQPDTIATVANTSAVDMATLSEVPGVKIMPMNTADGQPVKRMVHYFGGKRTIGSGWYSDPESFGGTIVHGVSDHWTAPGQVVGWEFGLVSTNAAWGSGVTVGELKVELTQYLTLWGPNLAEIVA